MGRIESDDAFEDDQFRCLRVPDDRAQIRAHYRSTLFVLLMVLASVILFLRS